MHYLHNNLLTKAMLTGEKDKKGRRESGKTETESRGRSLSPDPLSKNRFYSRERDNYTHFRALYDWRQDTPFWKKQGRWSRPSASKTRKYPKNCQPPLENKAVPHPQHHVDPFWVPFLQQQQPIPFFGSYLKKHPINGGSGPNVIMRTTLGDQAVIPFESHQPSFRFFSAAYWKPSAHAEETLFESSSPSLPLSDRETSSEKETNPRYDFKFYT